MKELLLFGFRLMRISRALQIFAFILVLFSTSCNDTDPLDCFKSTGNIVRVERAIGNFHSILLQDNVNLYLRQSDQIKLEVEGGTNLMPKIITTVSEAGVLEISNENSCNWVRSYNKPLNVYLDFVALDTLEYRSIGDVTNLDTIRVDSITVDVREGAGTIALTVHAFKVNANLHYGTADIILSGISTLGFYYQAGFGKIDNSALRTSQVYLENRSSNNIFVYSILTLEATINNIGDVYYKGNPSNILLSGTGRGKLIKME